jgi:hypothetical protein
MSRDVKNHEERIEEAGSPDEFGGAIERAQLEKRLLRRYVLHAAHA